MASQEFGETAFISGPTSGHLCNGQEVTLKQKLSCDCLTMS